MLEHYDVQLRGSSRWGEQNVLCPVHGERRASMRVNLEKGVFFCNACEAKGTAIDLIRLMEGCDRATAVARAEALALAAGLAITARPSSRYHRPGVSEESGVRGSSSRPMAAGSRYVPPGRR